MLIKEPRNLRRRADIKVNLQSNVKSVFLIVTGCFCNELIGQF